MRILILSCNTGEGHNTASKAIKEEMDRRGIYCEIIDALNLSSRHTSGVVCGVYKGITRRTPSVFGMAYKAGLKVTNKRFKSPLYYFNKPAARALYEYVVDHEIDTIVLPHLFPAETVTSLQLNKSFHFVRTYAIATDYTCIPFWEDLETDIFFVPHRDLIQECVDRGIPREKLVPTGIPVSARFNQKYDQQEMRRELNLDAGGHVFLLMTGSMGNGKVGDMVQEMLKKASPTDRIAVLGGNNEKLKANLREQYGKDERVRIVDFTREVVKYMAACDVLFTKPGGLTSSEAATFGVPLIHTAPIPGCETFNIEFFTKHGMSYYSEEPQEIASLAFRLADNPEEKQRMIEAQHKCINRYAARDISEYIIDHAK